MCFQESVEPLDSKQWMMIGGGVIGKYCNSQNPVLILANQEADKKVVTKDLNLKEGDVIQFKVRNVSVYRFPGDFQCETPFIIAY